MSKSLLEASLSKRKLVIPVGFQFKVLFGEVGCHLLFSEGHKITERATQGHFRLSDEAQVFFLLDFPVSVDFEFEWSLALIFIYCLIANYYDS